MVLSVDGPPEESCQQKKRHGEEWIIVGSPKHRCLESLIPLEELVMARFPNMNSATIIRGAQDLVTESGCGSLCRMLVRTLSISSWLQRGRCVPFIL